MPVWIVEQLIVQYGTEEASRIIKGISESDNKICVRVNQSKASVEEVINSLEKDDIKVTRSNIYKNCLYLDNVDYRLAIL